MKYYATDGEDPYGSWYLETLDSAGGWLGTAEDVLRFAVYGFRQTQTVQNPQGSEHQNYAREAFWRAGPRQKWQAGRGLLWMWLEHSSLHRRQDQYLAHGLAAGTSAEVAQTGNGVAFVVLFNARDTRDKKNAAGLIEGKLNETADAVKRWPR